MKKTILLFITTLTLMAYDFGDVIETKFSKIKEHRPYMVMVGKTECIWCDSMAPQIKEIKEEYPETVIYYVNVDKDPLGGINHNILELPVQIFYSNGKEFDRHIGYIGKEGLLGLLKESGVLLE
jgi:thioredoxin 1